MYDDLLWCINNNDCNHLKDIFKFYPNTYVSYDQASSLMWYAIKNGYDNVLKLLLKRNEFSAEAHITTICKNYASSNVPLLIIAISYSEIECVNVLVRSGADINGSSEGGFSPLGYALCLGERDIAYYLLLNGAKLNTFDMQLLNKFSHTFLDMADIIDFFRDTKQIRKELTAALVNKPKHTRTGAIPQDIEVKTSKYHSFSKERERQILRHIATQLYFSLKRKHDSLVEIQAMHLICEDTSNLFITANDFSVTQEFERIDKNNLTKKLTNTYHPRTTEEQARSSRYSKKLKRRVFGKEDITGEGRDLEKANFIKNILKIKDIMCITLDYSNTADKLSKASIKALKALFKEDNKIVFVLIKNCCYEKRHSEEFLCDIFSIAKETYGIAKIESAIAGKKRPCLGCKGRMDYESITNYSKRPGLFFKHTLENQSKAVARKTFENFNGHIYLSDVCSNSRQLPVSDFDSGSNSN